MNNISIVPMNSFSSSEGEKVFKKVSVENSRHTKAEQPITTSPREKTNQEKPHPKFKERVANFLDSSQVTIFMTVVTVSQVDLALVQVIAGECTTWVTIHYLLSHKTFERDPPCTDNYDDDAEALLPESADDSVQ